MRKFSKKLICGVMALAVTLASLPLIGIDFSGWFTKSEAATTTPEYLVSGDYVYYVEDSKAIIAKYIGSEVNVVVPEKIEGLSVYKIGNEAFTDSAETKTVNIRWKNEKLKDLESVVLPDCAEYICDSAFENCSKLTSIKLPERLYVIEDRAFYGTGLSEIDLPDYKLAFLSNQAFDKTNIKELVIPETVRFLYQGSLYAESLEKVIIEGYTFQTISANMFSLKVKPENGGAYRYIRRTPKEVWFLHSQSSTVIGFFDDMRKNEETGYWEAVMFEDGKTYYDYTDDDIKSNGTYEYIVTPEQEAIILSYNLSSAGTLAVSTVNDNGRQIPVVEIAPYAFSDCNLKGVSISNTVKRIGYAAFENCENLQWVKLPEGIKVIESDTFRGSNLLKLTDHPLPEGVTEIGYRAFYQCTVNYPNGADNVEKIGPYAFYNSSLCEFGFGNLKDIAPYAFALTTLGKLELPETVERIGDYAFNNAYLEEVIFPENLRHIGNQAFYGCTSLKKADLPQSLEYLGAQAFYNCKLTEAQIPPLLTEIKSGTFYNCPLKKVNIPSNIKVVNSQAFYNRSSMTVTEIIIAEGVEEIDSSAFWGSKVDELVIPSTVKWLHIGALAQVYMGTLYYNAIDAEVYMPSNTTGSLAGDVAGDVPTIVFGDGIKKIPEYFAYDSNVEVIELPESVECIGDYAFGNCFGLTSVNLPKNLKEIGERAFAQTDIRELAFPESLEIIGNRAFAGCSYLETVSFPASVEKIDDYAFASCKLLEKITLPQNADYVGQYAFMDCKAITEVTIPENVNSIGELTFYRCENIETVHLYAANCDVIPEIEFDEEAIPESPFITSTKLKNIIVHDTVRELPSFFYSGLQNIGEVALPESVTDIGVGAFANSSVSGFTSLAGIESIEEYAFKNCPYLEKINLGNNLLVIGTGAFTGCDWLESIYIPDSVSIIETSAFEGCTKLKNVRMSPNVDFIPRKAFNNCNSLSVFEWNSPRKIIGRYAFGNCVKLNDFDFINVEKLYKNSFTGSGVAVAQLGESQTLQTAALETIEVQSFKNCESLETVGIGGNVSTVKSQAFADCTNLETAVIADTVTEIAEDAFDGCNKLTIYCTEDSYAHSYAQTQGIKVSTFVIAPIPNQTYTGFEIKPEVSVSASGDTLDKNIDFSVTYANNINVGKADVNVKGQGDFRMFASRANFTIVTKNISNAVITEIPVQDYTGSAVTPEITVTCAGKILHEGTDYTVTYSNNTAEGTASIKITGKGNWSGSASAEFQIQKLSQPENIFNRVLSVFNSLFARIKAFFVGLFM